MKRLMFLAALFGFGSAVKAQKRSPDYEEGYREGMEFVRKMMLDYTIPAHTHDAKSIPFEGCNLSTTAICPPTNNKCPVCGRMAPSRPLTKEDLGPYVSQALVRCRRCNAAFWQTPEIG